MPRAPFLFRPILTWLGLFAVTLALAVPGLSKQDPFLGGVAGQTVPQTTLRNGTGDGTVIARVDATGFFGSSTDGLDFDPAGPVESSGTTFYSGLWFSGSNRAGQGGGTFLAGNTQLGAQFTSITDGRAVSKFTYDGLEWTLVQELLPPSGTGSTLRQTYTMKNVGFPARGTQSSVVTFDLLRHFDGDLTFDDSIQDVAVRVPGGQELYELDSNQDPELPTTFVGIDMNGQADLGFRIAEFSFTGDIATQGRGVLNGTLTMDGEAGSNTDDADRNDDGITDVPYDVTLTLGRSFQLPFGESATLVTNTILGTGAPNDLLAAPTNLTASRQGADKALLQWQDNSHKERGFEVQRRVGNGEFVKRGTTDANVNRFTDKKLKQNTVYTYRVRALRDGDPTAFSNEAVLDTGGGGETSPPRFIDPSPKEGTRFVVDPGEKLEFTVQANDPDTSLVVLSADGVPPGAVLSPPLPNSGNPVTATLNWTPTEKDKGIYDVLFTATEEDIGTVVSQVATRRIRILVGRVGVCVNGEVGESRQLRVDGEVGYPKGGRKFHQQLTMKLKAGNRTFKATEISRFELIGSTTRMEGVGTINGHGSFPFVLQAVDNGPSPRDRLLVVTVDGVPWPTGAMRRGEGVEQHL